MRLLFAVTASGSFQGITFFCTSFASSGDVPMARPKNARLPGVSVVTLPVRYDDPAIRIGPFATSTVIGGPAVVGVVIEPSCFAVFAAADETVVQVLAGVAMCTFP